MTTQAAIIRLSKKVRKASTRSPTAGHTNPRGIETIIVTIGITEAIIEMIADTEMIIETIVDTETTIEIIEMTADTETIEMTVDIEMIVAKEMTATIVETIEDITMTIVVRKM